MSRAEKAKEYFLQGYACSQAVTLAFLDVMDMDEETISKIMLPFGGGLGRLRLTCGAVSGMAAVIGMVFAKGENDSENKKQTYAVVQELCGKFREQTGSLVCAELLSNMKLPVQVGGEAEVRSPEYYRKRSCGDMVALAAQILEDYMLKKGVL